jgi:hypothetical protein
MIVREFASRAERLKIPAESIGRKQTVLDAHRQEQALSKSSIAGSSSGESITSNRSARFGIENTQIEFIEFRRCSTKVHFLGTNEITAVALNH